MEVTGTSSQRPSWLWIASIWSGVALFDATQTVFGMRAAGMHHAWNLLFVTTFLSWLPWALVTPLVLLLGHRYPPVRLQPLSAWFTHAGLAVTVTTVASAWIAWLCWWLNPFANPGGSGTFPRLWFVNFYNGLLASLMLYGGILAVGHILESRERLARQQTETARLNEQLSKAQLDALRRQIEPHFLFNALNSIAGLVREKRSDAAVSMLAGLSDFLRRVVADSSRQQVPLSEEMEFLQKYLDIQKIRFADRLQLCLDVPSELLPAQVPNLMLQPLVENAIKHGIAKRAQGGEIRVSASRRNGNLTISVYNDGPSLPAEWEEHPGVGLSNVRTRLRSLYGDKSAFTVRNQSPGGVEVLISLPFKED
jgi:two-component system LytT family sensor kinase